MTLPPKYDFSFTAQRSLVKFASGSLGPLATQLGEVKAITEVLLAARINALDGIQRVRVSVKLPSRSQLHAQVGKVLSATVRELRKFAHSRPIPLDKSSQPLRRPRLGLALGGGFARGIAHVGVLKVLVENQIPIDALAGISAGSIAAAAFASGCTIEELTVAARSLRWNRFARWAIPRLGFATNERMDLLLSRFSIAEPSRSSNSRWRWWLAISGLAKP